MKVLFALCLVSVALAGCSGGDAPDDSTNTSTVSSTSTTSTSGGPTGTTSTTTTTTTAPPASNTPPSASLQASINQGTAPVRVNFTLNANDADDDALAWEFDADGDGEADRSGADADLPAAIEWTYDEAGSYNATLHVDDGKNVTTAITMIVVEAASSAPQAATQQVSIAYPLGNAGCGAEYPTWEFDTPAAGVAWGEFQVDQATIGQAYRVAFAFEQSELLTMVVIQFHDDAGEFVDGGTFDFSPNFVLEGIVPEGATQAVVFDCAGLDATVEYATSVAEAS